ncbi:MAG: S-methyl-5-thioribose-1-phosphate isomerase [Candidatus Diapherotrites archaeon]|nr:S-methyl-5-thioribose-1-phosphate isomerase [Candidatus Diapherotrites archaeon]
MFVKFGKTKKWFTASWLKNSDVKMIDQRLLPFEFKVITLKNHKETAFAIKDMAIRGAGSIGAAAAFACAQAVLECKNERGWEEKVSASFETIAKTRPTARDLFYAIERLRKKIFGKNLQEAKVLAIKEAIMIGKEYEQNGKLIGRHGLKLIKEGSRILTHCNAGWLALHDWGSALAPLYFAKREGRKFFVFVDETRPRLQGAKLTSWELLNEGIKHKIIVDNAAGFFMQQGKIDLCIVGADRIAANGDFANKIGTYEKAIAAKENGIPFYVAAPKSTFDLECKNGRKIEIEERADEEVLFVNGFDSTHRKIRVAPFEAKATNPAFDITPAKYLSGIITERGIIKPKKSYIKKVLMVENRSCA